jgi:ribosome-interacting GTPase 1
MDGGSDDGPEQAAELVNQLRLRKTELGGESGFVDDDFSRVKIKTLFIVTRGDEPDAATRVEFFREMCDVPLTPMLMELTRPDSIEALRHAIYDALSVIRIYTKKPGKPAEKVDPFIIPAGGTVEDLAAKVHRELAESVKHARIWGTSAHDGQTVGKDHVLADEDVVELHT